MPIYAYKCDSCGFAKDVLQKISDQPLVQCPSCQAQTFKKQVTAAGFQLKGSGWYATDFKGGNNAAPASGDAKSDTKSDGKSDAKSDSKSESKSDSKSGASASAESGSPAKTSSDTASSSKAAPKKTESAPGTGSGS